MPHQSEREFINEYSPTGAIAEHNRIIREIWDLGRQQKPRLDPVLVMELGRAGPAAHSRPRCMCACIPPPTPLVLIRMRVARFGAWPRSGEPGTCVEVDVDGGKRASRRWTSSTSGRTRARAPREAEGSSTAWCLAWRFWEVTARRGFRDEDARARGNGNRRQGTYV